MNLRFLRTAKGSSTVERENVVFKEVWSHCGLQIVDWFVQICLGLKHIHDRKVLHRDIKAQVYVAHTHTHTPSDKTEVH